jgi:hypothetical protein
MERLNKRILFKVFIISFLLVPFYGIYGIKQSVYPETISVKPNQSLDEIPYISEFNKSWSTNYSPHGLVSSNNSIYIFGGFGGCEPGSVAEEGDSFLLTLNKTGDVIRNQTRGDTRFNTFSDGIISSNGGIALVEYYQYGMLCDQYASNLLLYNNTGELTLDLGITSNEIQDEFKALSLVQDSEGDFYIIGHHLGSLTIYKYREGGSLLWKAIKDKPESLEFDSVMDSTNNLYVLTGEEFYKFDSMGNLIWKYDSIQGSRIEIDSEDNFYILDGNSLTKYKPSLRQEFTISVDNGNDFYLDKDKNLFIIGNSFVKYNNISQKVWEVPTLSGNLTFLDNRRSFYIINKYLEGLQLQKYSLDNDRDRLADWQEKEIYKTDVTSNDTDGDRLLDGEEIHTYKTDPHNPDSDGDGFADGTEVFHGFDPNNRFSNSLNVIIISVSLLIGTMIILSLLIWKSYIDLGLNP